VLPHRIGARRWASLARRTSPTDGSYARVQESGGRSENEKDATHRPKAAGVPRVLRGRFGRRAFISVSPETSTFTQELFDVIGSSVIFLREGPRAMSCRMISNR
jgi:hypothetical protein